MEMGNLSDLSVSMLSPSSDRPIIDPELWLDSRPDSSKRNSTFQLCCSCFCDFLDVQNRIYAFLVLYRKQKHLHIMPFNLCPS